MPDRCSLSELDRHSSDRYSEQLTNVAIHRSSAISPSSTSIHFREKAIQRAPRRDSIRCQSVFSCKRRFREIFSLVIIYIPDQTFVSEGEIIISHHIVSNMTTMEAAALKLDQVVIIESSVTFAVATLK